MAGQAYYSFPDTYLPDVQLAVLEAVRYYICSNLYPDEDYTTVSSLRFIQADFESGTDSAVRASIKGWEKVAGKFPFTAFNLGEVTLKDEGTNRYEKSGQYYSETLEKDIYSIPVKFQIPMATFYTQPSDYFHGQTILMKMQGLLQRLVVPITINGIEDYFECNLRMEINKGSLAYALEEQLQYGDIYDIFHTATIQMRHFVIEDAKILPVDDIEISLNNYNEDNYQLSTEYETMELPDQPVISTIVPNDEATDVSIDSNVVITFNVPMDEESVEMSIGMYPWIVADYDWNDTSTILTINSINDLENDTEYTIEVDDSAKSIYTHALDQEYEFTFTTVA